MALPADYVSGTITLTAGSTAFTGTGTGWIAADFRQGDLILDVLGGGNRVAVVAAVTGNGAGTLTKPWEGPTLANVAYRLRYQWDSGRVSAQTRTLIEQLGNGNLQSLAAITGAAGNVVVFNGPGAIGIEPRTNFINGVAYDVQVNTLADRAAYNGQSAGFTVLVSNVGDGRSAVYSKASNASGDWTNAAYVTGPTGPASTVPGIVWRGTYAAGTTYAINEGVTLNGSSFRKLTTAAAGTSPSTAVPPVNTTDWEVLAARGVNGTITGVTPFWNTRITGDTDAIQARAGLDTPKRPASPSANTVATVDANGDLLATPIVASPGGNLSGINALNMNPTTSSGFGMTNSVATSAAFARYQNDVGNGFEFGSHGSAYTAGTRFGVGAGNASFASNNLLAMGTIGNAALQFFTNNSYSGSFLGNGYFVVGLNNSAFAVVGAGVIIGPDGTLTSKKVGTGSQAHVTFGNNAAVTPTQVGAITTSGSATAYLTSSDYRLKFDVAPLVTFELSADQFDGLPDNLLRVMALNPVSHGWLVDPDGPRTHGLIAHEAQIVVSDAVTGEKDATIDVGCAVIPARIIPASVIPGAISVQADVELGIEEQREPDILVPEQIIPEQVLDGLTESECPEGATWTKTGERILPQGIDTSFIVADLIAAVQELTLMVLSQKERIAELEVYHNEP